MKLLNKLRRHLVAKLIRPEDGYTYTGFSEGEPIKFYYQEDTDKYLLGSRSDNWYYHSLGLTGWGAEYSRYLPWGALKANCKFNPTTGQMQDAKFPSEPQEIDFITWIYGLSKNAHKNHLLACGQCKYKE